MVLVAYLETTPQLSVRATKRSFLFEHTSKALVDVRRALKDPEKNIDDGLCFAIILLMITSVCTLLILMNIADSIVTHE